VSGFFDAAAECYRAAPWVRLANDQPIALRISAERGDERIAVVMGNAGMEYGLAVYENWAEFEQLYAGVDDPVEALPAHGSLVMFMNPCQRCRSRTWTPGHYGWPGSASRPIRCRGVLPDHAAATAPDELAWLEAALRAMVAAA
jgi:hypothetical protein